MGAVAVIGLGQLSGPRLLEGGGKTGSCWCWGVTGTILGVTGDVCHVIPSLTNHSPSNLRVDFDPRRSSNSRRRPCAAIVVQ